MKKNFYFLLMTLLISQNLLAIDKTWTGATSTSWATSSNWSPSGVPTSSDIVIINDVTNDPQVQSGTTAVCKNIFLNNSSILTINSGGTLTINETSPTNSGIAGVAFYVNARIINNGTLNVTTNSSSLIIEGAGASFTNNNVLNITSNFRAIACRGNNQSCNNTGTITINGASGLLFASGITGTTSSNSGTINFNGTGVFLEETSGVNFTNSGTINSNSGIGITTVGGTFTNQSCGKLFLSSGTFDNSTSGSSVSNSGVIAIAGDLNNTSGVFTNNSGGTLKYNSLTGTVTKNNGSVIVNNDPTNTTIFTYQGTFTGTINGIYTNAAATTTAGTFTAPNTFTPSGTLPTGSQTLYAKITPSSGACNYVVPFTYNNIIPPSITTTGTLSTFSSCPGIASASQSFTVSGANLTANIIVNAPIGYEVATSSGGPYSSSVSLTQSSGTVNTTTIYVRLNSGAAGTYASNVTCTSTGATTKNVAASGTVFSAPTLTVGTSTNPTTCLGTDGSIAFTTTNLVNGNYTLNYSKNNVATTATITVSANAFTLTGLTAGTYTPFSITTNGCTGTVSTSKVLSDPPTPTLTVGTSTNPTTCSGTNGNIAFTTTNLANGNYTLNYSKNNVATTTTISVLSNAFTLTGLTAGVYTPFSITNNGCSTGSVTTSKTLSDPATPTLTVGTPTNPTTCSGTNGSITFTTTNLANGSYTLNYSRNGTATTANITVSANAFTLSGLTAGVYTPFSITNNGCSTGSVTTSKTLSDPATPTLTVGTSTNPTTCGGTNGSIAFTTTNLANGTYTLNYSRNGTATTANITVSANAFTLSGLSAGTYTPFSITNNGCSTGSITTSKVLSDPVTPTLTVGTSVNPSTCSGTNGSIAFSTTNLANGTYTLNYSRNGTAITSSITVSANAFTLSGLTAGTYTPFSITNNGCSTGSITTSKVLSDPATPTISVGTVINPATCGATGSIPFTASNLPDGTYSLSFTAIGTGATTSPRNVVVSNNAFSLTGLSVGSYSNFSLISTGCVATDATSKTIANPTTPTLVAGTAVNPTSCGGTDGSIPFTTNLPDGTYSLSYTGTGSPKSITVSGGAFNLGSLGSGGYSNFSVTNNGCVGTASTSKSLSDPAAPVLTLGTTTNPSACNLADGSIAFTVSNIANGTYSLTYSGTGSPKSVIVSSNAFTLNGLADGVYSNFSITNENGCTGSLSSSVTLVDLALPVLTVGASNNPTSCTGTQGTIAFTTANLPDGTYSLSFISSGTASPQNIIVANNTFTLGGLSAGTYSNFSVTRLGCTGSVSTSKTLVDPVVPTLTAGASVNPTTCAGTDGSISFTTTNLANGTYSLSFTSTGTLSPKNVTVTNNTFTLSGLKAGNYNNFSLTNNGCTAIETTAKTLSDPASITLTTGTSTNPTTCSGTDGSINFTTTNLPDGNYTLTYTGAGSPKTVTISSNTFSIGGLSAGAYSNFSITYLGCIGSDSQTKTLFDPESATLKAGLVTNPSTCNGTDGSIAFTSTNLPNGNYSLSYTGAGSQQTVVVSNNTFTLTGLSAGNYSNFSLVLNGCTAIEPTSKSLVAPSIPTLTAGSVINPSTCSGSNGSIAFTTSLPNGTYSLSYTGANSPQNITVTNGAFTLNGLSAGVYANFSIISNGCTSTDETSKTLVDPNTPTLTAGTVTNPSTCNGTDGSIAFTTNFANGTYSLVYTGAGSPKTITIANGAFTLSGLQDGVYANFAITSNGCISVASTTKTLVDPPTPTLNAGAVTNPSSCSGTDGKIAFTTSLPNGTYTLNYSGLGSPKNIMVVNGTFELTGLSSGTYSGFSVLTNGCTGTDATTKTLTDPTAPTFTAGTVTNPTTCLSSDGKIAFTTTLPNGTYTLNYTGTGSPKSVTVVSGVFELTGLPDGTFSGFSITFNGCTGTDATTKTLTDPAAPTLTTGTTTNPSTCSSTDGSIAFTTSLPNGTYTLNYTGTGSPKSITVVNGAFTLTGLPDGTFSGFSVTTGGCTGIASASVTLTDPTSPTISAGAVTNPSACNGTDGSIAFTTTLSNGNYTLNYTGSGSPKTITVVSGGFTLSGLSSGDYSGFSITSGGCVGIDNKTKSLVNPNPPTLSVGIATNPSTCAGTGSIDFTTSLPNGTYSLSYTGMGSPKSVTVTNGGFSLSGLIAGTYSDFSINNGNGCVGTDATSKTLSEPNALTITAGIVTNPSICSGNDGSIAFTTNLPNGTYSLSFTGTGSPKNVTVSNGTFSLTGLSAGTYSNFSVTNNGCTGTDATTKNLSDPLAPSALISGNENLNCSITNVIRTATGGTSYSWSNGLGTNASVSISTPGIYSVTVTVNGCTATATTSVTLDNTAPIASISGIDNLSCTVISVQRTASGVGSYSWSNGLGTNATVNIATAGIYTVTVTGTNGCTATATTSVIFTNNLVATASNTGPFQTGNTIQLNASGGASYAWIGPNSFASTVQNPSIPNALVIHAGIYTVTVSSGSCTATATTNVIVSEAIDPCIPIIDYQFVKAGNPYQPLFNLTNGIAINQLSDPVSIIAVPICPTINIESLLMKLQGPNMNEEILQNVSPYAIFDNTANNVNGRILSPGVYTLTVTGYNQDNLLGGINYGPVITTFTILPNTASISIPTVSKTTVCIESTLDVNFSTSGTFNNANQFRVELSDANGNFGSIANIGNNGNSANFIYPTIIGNSSTSGTISCIIPSNIVGGTNYRIRVVSTDGVSISQVNGSPITIHPRDLNLVSPTDDFSTNIGTKQASNKVTASNKISATANVNYQAGKAIILNAGFEANAGAVFKAEIRGCEN